MRTRSRSANITRLTLRSSRLFASAKHQQTRKVVRYSSIWSQLRIRDFRRSLSSCSRSSNNRLASPIWSKLKAQKTQSTSGRLMRSKLQSALTRAQSCSGIVFSPPISMNKCKETPACGEACKSKSAPRRSREGSCPPL